MYNNKLTPYYKLFENAPISAAILHADTLKVEMANDKILDLWARPPEIIGISLLDAMPELEGQRYPDYMEEVCRTGNSHEESGARVLINRAGKYQNVFMDYSYTPIFGQCGKTTGILVMGTDVCERELNRLIIQQSYRDLRALVMSAPVAMCIYRNADFTIEAVNSQMLDLWQDKRHRNMAVLQHVYHNGRPYTFTEGGITYTYTPLGNGIKNVSGVCVIAVCS